MGTMSKKSKDNLDTQVQGVIATLLELRDVVRLDLHLASMDARDKWNKDYEPQIFNLKEKAVHAGVEVKKEIHKAAVDLAADVRKFAAAMK